MSDDSVDGFRTVPVDPTVAMVEAGRKAMEPEKFVSHARTMWVWEAMLKAAPSDQADRILGSVLDRFADRALKAEARVKELEALTPRPAVTRTPAEAFPVSRFLREEMDERGWGINDLVAHMAGEPQVNEMCVRMCLTIDEPDLLLDIKTAEAIGRAFGSSTEYWMNLDAAYRRHVKALSTFPATQARTLPTRKNLAYRLATLRWAREQPKKMCPLWFVVEAGGTDGSESADTLLHAYNDADAILTLLRETP